jgi:hypothetical protein
VLPGALPPFANAVAPASNTASAPAAVTPKAGDVVYDKTGAQAGSVACVNGNVLVVATEQGKGSMPLAALPLSANGLILNRTKAELEAAIRTASASQAPAPQTPSADATVLLPFCPFPVDSAACRARFTVKPRHKREWECASALWD